jgi:hypothetical protein
MKSSIPIWKCVWCRKRRDQPTDKQIKFLEAFVRQYGWSVGPLIFHENGWVCHAYGQLPPMREASTELRSSHRVVRALQADNAANNIVGLSSGKGERAMAGSGSNTALEAGVELD